MHCKKVVVVVFLFFTFHFSLFTFQCEAALRDRVVAFVDNRAITLSEFEEQYKKTKEAVPDVTEEEVANTMINRILLLREAKKYRIEAPTDDGVIKEYIDLKVRAFITVGENEIEAFFKQNIHQFAGRDYDQVRGEIEKYLTEKELNERLKSMLKELRINAYIKIQLKP